MIKKGIGLVLLGFTCILKASEQVSEQQEQSKILSCLLLMKDWSGYFGHGMLRGSCHAPFPLQCCLIPAGCICCCTCCVCTVAAYEVSELEKRCFKGYITSQPKRN